MKEAYRKISAEQLKIAYAAAWSIESMQAHGAADRSTEYIGSHIGDCMSGGGGWLVTDYYKDSSGEYWYKNRVLTQQSELITMEQYLFGKTVREYSRPRKRYA